MVTKKSLKVESGEKTAAELIKIARKIFSKKGYAATSMEEIVSKAGVTRGALYHHFKGKIGLFKAVFKNGQEDILCLVNNAIKGKTDPWERLYVSSYAWLKSATDPDLQRIILIDAPSILGWTIWRSVDEQKSSMILRQILSDLLDAKEIKPLPLDALTHVIAGAANELVLWVAESENSKIAFEEAWIAFKTFIDSCVFSIYNLPWYGLHILLYLSIYQY